MLKKVEKIGLIPLLLTTSLGVMLNPVIIYPVESQDFPYPPNSTFFTGKPPSFQGARVFYNSIYAPDVPYYFTFYLPEQSIQSIGKVTIQQNTSPYTLDFRFSQTQAFLGTPDQKQTPLKLKTVSQDPETGAIAVEFETPIPPGSTFTVGLEAVQNPSIGGTYGFTVRAFPAGPQAIGMNLGVGQIQIYDFRP
jgi:hypothetical protein